MCVFVVLFLFLVCFTIGEVLEELPSKIELDTEYTVRQVILEEFDTFLQENKPLKVYWGWTNSSARYVFTTTSVNYIDHEDEAGAEKDACSNLDVARDESSGYCTYDKFGNGGWHIKLSISCLTPGDDSCGPIVEYTLKTEIDTEYIEDVYFEELWTTYTIGHGSLFALPLLTSLCGCATVVIGFFSVFCFPCAAVICVVVQVFSVILLIFCVPFNVFAFVIMGIVMGVIACSYFT